MKVTDFFTFERQLAPILVNIAYWIGLAFIALGVLAGIAGTSIMGHYMWGMMGGGIGLIGFLMSIIGGIVGIVVWRLICEMAIVVFSINDRLGKLVELKTHEIGDEKTP